MCEILGLEKPEWLEGHSFLPILRGEAQKIRTEVFGEINYHVAYEPARCVRTCRYKYIARWDNGYEYAPPVDTDDSLSKEVLREFGYFQRKRQSEELYDLMLDPQERENLAGEDTYASVLADMRERLKSWQMKSGDPLLARGRMELPEGAICATADSYSTKSQVLLPECEKYVAALRGLLQNPIG